MQLLPSSRLEVAWVSFTRCSSDLCLFFELSLPILYFFHVISCSINRYYHLKMSFIHSEFIQQENCVQCMKCIGKDIWCKFAPDRKFDFEYRDSNSSLDHLSIKRERENLLPFLYLLSKKEKKNTFRPWLQHKSELCASVLLNGSRRRCICIASGTSSKKIVGNYCMFHQITSSNNNEYE